MSETTEYYEERIQGLQNDLDKAQELIACLRADLADALKLAQDYRNTVERLEQELRETFNETKSAD